MLRSPHFLEVDEGLQAKDRELAKTVNSSLERLDHLRAVEINVAGPFLRSKISWKLATYQHALLHRVVALMDGVAVAWNSRSTLTTILAARAFMETLALMAELTSKTEAFLASKDLKGLNDLAQRGVFASRDTELLNQTPEIKAVNVLTYIDRINKDIPGFRAHYDALSERCHPNALGHSFMFSKLDLASGTVTYMEEREIERNRQMILAAISVLPMVEHLMKRLDNSIIAVSDLQHRLDPIGK
uniref:Uncharacterized protein n=1 Tax=Rhodopseudomonas palustris (strain DX-1) TaxID=652103 RepID=E6VND1_RHOPX